MVKIDREYALRLLGEMVNIESVYGNEKEIMVFLENDLRSMGLKPRRYPLEGERFSSLVRWGEGKPVVCLNAHSDTVLEKGSRPQAVIKDGRMYGLGACDDKASLASMLSALKAIVDGRFKLKGSLDLLISVDEEGQGRGVVSAIEQGYSCDYAIVGEVTDLELIVAHNGILFLDLETIGKGTHGSRPWRGRNAIDIMYNLIGHLRELVKQDASHELVGPPSLNLGMMSGGEVPNRVPSSCHASVDIRVTPNGSVDEMVKRIEGLLEAKEWEGTSYRIRRRGESMATDMNSQLVRTFLDSIKEVTGKEAEPKGWRGWAEADPFRNLLGIDTVVFGPGHIQEAHSEDEFVDLEQVYTAGDVYLSTILKMQG